MCCVAIFEKLSKERLPWEFFSNAIREFFCCYEGEQDKKESLAQGHHPLECMWTFWFDKKQSKGQGASVSSTASYQENLRRVGSVRTVEEFWRFTFSPEVESRIQQHLAACIPT